MRRPRVNLCRWGGTPTTEKDHLQSLYVGTPKERQIGIPIRGPEITYFDRGAPEKESLFGRGPQVYRTTTHHTLPTQGTPALGMPQVSAVPGVAGKRSVRVAKRTLGTHVEKMCSPAFPTCRSVSTKGRALIISIHNFRFQLLA